MIQFAIDAHRGLGFFTFFLDGILIYLIVALCLSLRNSQVLRSKTFFNLARAPFIILLLSSVWKLVSGFRDVSYGDPVAKTELLNTGIKFSTTGTIYAMGLTATMISIWAFATSRK